MLGFLSRMFRRGDLPDLPPKEFRDLPPPPDWRIQYFDSLDELGKWARENGIEANDAYVKRRFVGGAAPKLKVVGLPRPGLAGDRTFDDYLYRHEVGGHSNGLVHHDGGLGWGVTGPDGKFYPVQTIAERDAILGRLATHFDWSGVLKPHTQTGASVLVAPPKSPGVLKPPY